VVPGIARRTTIGTAVKAAGLVDTLSGPGPFTVFAPTDAAFAKLPPGTLDNLLKNTPALKNVLLYHVVPGELMAADLAGKTSLVTAQGSALPVVSTSSGVKVDSATVVKADILCSNGVIHVIDAVMLPPSPAPCPSSAATTCPAQCLPAACMPAANPAASLQSSVQARCNGK